MAIKEYKPSEIEAKWQQYWEDNNLFAASESSERRTMYVLDMFPYPSGDGLHVGHVKIYTASDVVSRYLRMRGYNVLHPTGWDAFGLPTENTAIKTGIHPAKLTKKNTDHFRQQMKLLGFSYDWSREVNTSEPEYYKWTQWIFLQLYRMGLAYEDTIPIHWCPSCKTGLANEEVVEGKCDRCSTEVEKKMLKQWMLRITRYADQLLKGLEGLDWPSSIVEMQENWIGRSEGVEVKFPVETIVNQYIDVFTTRVDTLYGVTYLVLAPEHELVARITTPTQKEEVERYVKQALSKTDLERTELVEGEKTGVFTGAYALQPITGKKLPIWVADYVVRSYGTGAVMGVPAHDERDFEFAKAFDLPIIQVIEPAVAHQHDELPFMGEGILVNSDDHSGQTTENGRKLILDRLQMNGRGQRSVNYRLHDWVFSRQRYWGEPIPVIHCEKCGVVPVPEDKLPVELPEVEKYEPTGTGESPLAAIEEWVQVKCPTCPGMGRRETNTMPQWAGSSWYFLRFADPHNQEALADPQKLLKWLPVDVYMGGAEHAVLHLLYARFWTHALNDAGIIPIVEPFQRLRSVGLVMGEDGQKMSKSRGNVVNPDDEVKRYGADTTRVFALFMGPFHGSNAWTTTGIQGAERFIKRVWHEALRLAEARREREEPEVELKLHQTIQRVTESIEQFKFNTAISALMEMLNMLAEQKEIHPNTLAVYVRLLSPFAPHLAEELWQSLGFQKSVGREPWPKLDESILERAEIDFPIQVDGKVRGTIQVPQGANQEFIEEKAKKISNVTKYLAEGKLQQVIFVPDRLINFVLKSK